MQPYDLRIRTKDFAKRIIQLCRVMPQHRQYHRIADQIFRSGTSVGANYRSACRSRSKAEFISKLNIALEEADETLYWLELLEEAHLLPSESLVPLKREANELVAILVSSLKTTKRA